eukprot:scaffold51522_cov18-Tisochrysis_lutea.AAC.5
MFIFTASMSCERAGGSGRHGHVWNDLYRWNDMNEVDVISVVRCLEYTVGEYTLGCATGYCELYGGVRESVPYNRSGLKGAEDVCIAMSVGVDPASHLYARAPGGARAQVPAPLAAPS